MNQTTSFIRALNFVMSDKIEGGYSDDSEDPGNWTGGKVGLGELNGTKYGISAAAYPRLDIKNLRRADATDIYHRDYWATIKGDLLPPQVAFVVFDCAVNQGVATAAKLLQASVGTEIDGLIGPNTLAAVRRYEQSELVVDFLARRAVRYAGLTTFKRYGRGWMRRLFFAALEA